MNLAWFEITDRISVNQEKQLSMSELLKKAFTNGVSNAQQKMYDMQCNMNNFKEDF